jgi:hypothetical protein
MAKAILSEIGYIVYPKDLCMNTSNLSQKAKFNRKYQKKIRIKKLYKQLTGHNLIIQNQSPEPNH